MPDSPPDKIKFDYIKSNQFRTARADGMVCGANGQADIILNFFSERSAIPQRSVHHIVAGRLGDEIPEERVAREAMVREVEISLSMSLGVARAAVTALTTQIKAIEDQVKLRQTGEQKQ